MTSGRTRLSTWGHACVQLERDGRLLVVDPGSFSDRRVVDTADAVLVTHEHQDHVMIDELAQTLAGRPELAVWAPESVSDQLVTAGAPPARVHSVVAGERFAAAGFDVQVLGEVHEVVHRDVPVVANRAYLINGTVLHPGDSFTFPRAGQHVRVLLVPVSGPWLRLGEAIDFVRAVGPGVVVPIHDALLSTVGNALVDRLVSGLGGAGEYRRLAVGEALELD